MADRVLSISLLVSGRTDTTEKCLLSIKRLREELDAEIILVDTGCPDSWQEPLTSYADQVVRFTWCNDFAKARNAGLALATGEWFLFLDDDEWFEDVAPIVTFFQSGEYREYQQAVYKVRNYSKADGSAYTDEWVSRMIQRQPDTHFEGSVHESLVPATGRCKKIDAFVHHYGYVFENEEQRCAHRERNVQILKDLLDKEPNNMKWYLQILQEYADPSTTEELKKYAASAIELIENKDDPFINQCRGAFYTASLLADLWADQIDQLLVDCETFAQDGRNTFETNYSVYYYWIQGIMRKRKDPDLTEDEANELQKKLEMCGREYVRNCKLHDEQEKTEQEQIIEESILFVKDVKKSEEILHDLQTKLENNGEFLLMEEEYWTYGMAHIVPLEQMLLELPFSQWMAEVVVLKAYNSEELWDKIRMHLIEIQTVENIRYDYFHAQAVNAVITKCANGKSYDELKQYLWEYATCNLKFAQWVYTDAAFSGEMEMVEESCRAAIWIHRALECGENDWTGMLDHLKKAAKAWPELGKTVKQFALLIGDQQENIEKRQAEGELAKMAAEVKQQVITLTESGMHKQALEIVKQLRRLLPDDEDFLYLERELEKQLT